jgi:hypothetical protein
MKKARPGVGEKRKTRQPLNIDKLPGYVHEEIKKRRAAGETWIEIEKASREFVKWDDLPTRVLELFPEMRIPVTNLMRWHDLRVEQAHSEILARSVAARELAEKFAERGFEKMPEAVMNALSDVIFMLMEKPDVANDRDFRKDMAMLGLLLAENKKNELRERKVAVEEKRLGQIQSELDMKLKRFEKATNDAAAKLGKGKELTIDDINRIRERTFGLPPIQRSASIDHPA